MPRAPATAAPLRRRAAACALLPALLGGCVGTGVQDVLAPTGPQAARIADWFWISYALAVAVFVAFAAILAYGLLRARRRERRGEPAELPPSHGRGLVIWGGIVVPTAILLTLLVLSAYTDRRISRLGRGPGEHPVTIQVVGHQFWWEVRYRDPANPHREFTTANELRVPVGRPVRLVLSARDVIHSFWVPNLHGKMDLIPGRTNDLVLQVDEPGVYRGQCAEFCGTQHAKMAMLVEALPPAEFAAWWERQLRPHPTPVDSALARGHDVFMQNGCGLCHSIRGTEAHGSVAPDLSYFGERRTIAAGTLPNTRGHLGGWISDPQAIKPGNRMPAVPLEGDDLRALLSYLHSLR
ncbi:MAG TPA: cytochrome c oxidase subunit II [Longimicrobiaceae bacterium]|nr:cytochrome c oxidase subunit II [Longimicrobiaceae bacterium]